jgi:multidrug efflux pump subunit AcrA (membrane-fusion protein)
MVDPTTRTAEGRVTLDNADGALRPGASAVASIALPLEDPRRWLPREAVQPHEGADVVFVPAGDGFEARPVRVGEERGGRVPVLSGLDGVERVVVRGAFALRGELERDELGEDE